MGTPLDSPLYTLTDALTGNVWQGNAVDDSGCAWIVETEDGWSSSSPARPTQVDKTMGDGTWTGEGFYAGRLVTLTGTCVAPSQLAMLWAKENIKSAIGPHGLATLQVEELHLTRQCQVRLNDKVELQDKGNIAFTYQMGLFAGDPRKYAMNSVSLATGLPPGGTTGRTYSRVYPLIYGGAGLQAAGSVVFYQIGNYSGTPAVITIFGPVISPTIQHTQSGKSLTFNMTVQYNQWLVIDLSQQTALLQGTQSVINTITGASAWFMLTPGPNELRFRGQAGPVPVAVEGSVAPVMQVVASSAWS